MCAFVLTLAKHGRHLGISLFAMFDDFIALRFLCRELLCSYTVHGI